MQTPRTTVWPGLLAALMLTTAPVACGDKKSGATAGQADGKAPVVEAKADEGATPGASGDAGASGGAAEAGTAPSAAASGGTEEAGGSGAGGTAEAEAGGTGAAAAGGSGGAQDQAAESTGGGPDTAALLKELKRKRTKDKRATEIVAQLEAAEVESEELAKALTARGKALFASPERAKAMFELALGKDAELPDPAFELAKQAAVLGELDEAKKWLKVVHERKGKKLLKQIEFDPMWEILKDDPDVRALLK